jgi:hypothetical protein
MSGKVTQAKARQIEKAFKWAYSLSYLEELCANRTSGSGCSGGEWDESRVGWDEWLLEPVHKTMLRNAGVGLMLGSCFARIWTHISETSVKFHEMLYKLSLDILYIFG